MTKKYNGYFYYKNGSLRYVDDSHEYKVTNQQKARFREIVDNHPRKWEKGKVNEVIIDNHCFRFVYNNYEDDSMGNLYMIVRYKVNKNGR